MAAKCVKDRQGDMEGVLTRAVDINCILMGMKLQLLMPQTCRAKFILLLRGRMTKFKFGYKIERGALLLKEFSGGAPVLLQKNTVIKFFH